MVGAGTSLHLFNDDDDALESLISFSLSLVPLIILFTRLAKWKMNEEESAEVSRGMSFFSYDKAQAAEASKAESFFYLHAFA